MKRLLIQFPGRRLIRRGFTLIEVLVVMAIVCALAALSGPAVQAISGAGTVNKAIADLSGTVEAARAHAMANRTYVRLAIAQDPSEGTIVLALCSADGSLDAAGPQDMANPVLWRQLNRAVILKNFVISDDAIRARVQAEERVPSESDIEAFSRPVAGMKTAPRFDQFIQFSPNGEARVESSAVARFIKIGVDQAGGQSQRTPFELVLSGSNGTVTVLRADDNI